MAEVKVVSNGCQPPHPHDHYEVRVKLGGNDVWFSPEELK